MTQLASTEKLTIYQSPVQYVQLARASPIPIPFNQRMENPHLIGVAQQLYGNPKQHDNGCGRTFLRRPHKNGEPSRADMVGTGAAD
jgi:hypothetical protein